ncbi:hypothetical protein FRC00_002450 [Tulasnella sp. 408]|nr:hypothetical protein FRC00_002450 [Tulasnella sp. 408]
MQGEVYRNLKLAVVQQEIAVYEASILQQTVSKVTSSHQTSSTSEGQGLTGQEDLISTLPGEHGTSPQPVLLGDTTNAPQDPQETEEERRARKQKAKEDKRARKEARRLEKRIEKGTVALLRCLLALRLIVSMPTVEKKRNNKRALSPSPIGQNENTANVATQSTASHDGSEQREAKRLKVGTPIVRSGAQSTIEVIDGTAAREKRKRGVDELPARADPSLSSVDPPARDAKRHRAQPPDPNTLSDSSLNDHQLLTTGTVPGLPPLNADSPILSPPNITRSANQKSKAAESVSQAQTAFLRDFDRPTDSDDQAEPSGLETSPQQADERPAVESDAYGAPVRLPKASRGYYSTSYYPDRKVPFQIPTGQLSSKARAERYKGLTENQIAAREAEYKTLSENFPLVFREAFKHTARGRLDRVAHLWLIPRVHNYYHTKSDGRSALLDRIVRDLVHEFPDLHPNFLKLKNSAMEKEYLTSLRNLVSVATSGIKSALDNPSKVESIDKDIIKQLTGTNRPSRPHDLWATSLLNLLKTEDKEPGSDMESDDDDDDNREEQLTQARALRSGWEEMYDQVKKTKGAKCASRNRLKLQQDYWKRKFELLSEEQQAFWGDLAGKTDRSIDPVAALEKALPFVNKVIRRFCEITKIPMVVLAGAPDQQNPGKFTVYYDTFSSAPSEIPDFLDGPDRLGDTILVPAFRTYVAQYFGASKENVAEKVIPLPSPPEESHEMGEADPGTTHDIPRGGSGETVGVTTPSGVSFVITPTPQDWTVPSKELEKIRSKIKDFITSSYKKAHGKQRTKFYTLVTRSDSFIDSTILPTTKFTSIRDADGKPAVKESDDPHIVYTTDPMTMQWYQVKAFYDLLKNPNSKFEWLVEKSSTSGRLTNPPASIQQTLQNSQSVDPQANKAKGRRKSKSNQDVAVGTVSEIVEPPRPSSLVHVVEPSQSAKGRIQRKKDSKRNPDSEDDAISSDDSGESSDFTVGSESSKGEDYRPDAAFILRSETVSIKGRRSAPHPSSSLAKPNSSNLDSSTLPRAATQASGGDEDSDDERRTEPEDTARPAPLSRRPAETGSKSGSLLFSPDKRTSTDLRHEKVDTKPPYVVKPTVEPESTDVPVSMIATLESVRELSIPKSLREDKLLLPDLHLVITHCARLDRVFGARDPLLPSLPVPEGIQNAPSDSLQQLWSTLNDPSKPVPTFQNAERLAPQAGISMKLLATEVLTASLTLVELLEGHDMLEEDGPDSFQFVSWTKYFLVLSRYLKFAESVDPMERQEGYEDLPLLHERIIELAVIHIIVRYCVESILSHIADLPAPSESWVPTIANAIPTLSRSWARMVRRICCPLDQFALSQVWGPNWASSINPTAQLDQNSPFFSLNTPIKRWITVTATEELYDKILELEKGLHSQPNLLEDMPIYTQATFFASVFAVHVNEGIRGSDDDGWLGIIDKLLEVTEYAKGGSSRPEIERNPNQPPPTLVSTMQQEPVVSTRPRRPRACHPSTKSNWSVGDIARLTVNGEEQNVVFSYKLKDGRGRYLVMADLQTGKEIFAADGETELPLPPFSPSALVKTGSRDPVESALLRVHPYWDLPKLTFDDMARPELAGYFAQFRNLPDEDDDPSVLEKLGFKPPEFFIKKYEQDCAVNATESGSRPSEATAAIQTSSESTSPGAALVPSPTTHFIHDSILPIHPVSQEGAEIEPDSGVRGGTEAAHAGEPRKVQDPAAGVDEAKKIGSGREGEVNEEEEVENVLASNAESNALKAGSVKKGKGKNRKAAGSANQKVKEGASAANPKPINKNDQPAPKRTSARLHPQNAPGPSVLSVPSPPPTRRMSTRKKQGSNDAPPSNTAGPTTRSRKKPE